MLVLPESPGAAAACVEDALSALSAIGPQVTEAEARLAEGPGAAEPALAALQRSADAALAALRHLLDVLPEPVPSAYAPQPGLADAYREARRRAAAGTLSVAVGDVGQVPAGVQLLVHHALVAGLALHDRRGGTAAVRLDRRGGTLVLALDLGPAAGEPWAPFPGLDERTALYGGVLRWDGRRLDLRVPLAEAAK
ncbi:MAG TPA: hypothetical protein VF533_06440 [Solirubrobacteraceae bacterium]